MKRIIYLLISLSLVSCSLNLPIEDEIVGFDSIDNVLIANEALSSAYLSIPKNKIEFSILADDFYPNHNISQEQNSYNFYKWNHKELITLSNNRWDSYYNTISKLNILLKQIPKIKGNNPKESSQLNYILAQTLSLKAYCYFYLIQLYGKRYDNNSKNSLGIILKDKIESEELPRATLENSYKATEELLLKAIDLFSTTGFTKKSRLSEKGAKVLLSRLYLNWKKYDESIKLCDEIINDNDLNKTNYDESWKTPWDNPEVLFVFEYPYYYFSTLENTSNKQMFYINLNIHFSNTDYRKPIVFLPHTFITLNNKQIEVNYLGKYRENITSNIAKPILAIRRAEVYFIKAEAQYHLGEIEKAKATLNGFLKLRDAQTIASEGKQLLLDILKEKQKEFLGEGQRYFDIKRNQLDLIKVEYRNNTEILKIQPDDFRWQFPIPFNEIKQNRNVKQNPKWGNYVY